MINHWAGDGNPFKRGVVVRTGRNSGRVNPGPWVECTDMKGRLWRLTRGENLEVVGSVIKAEGINS